MLINRIVGIILIALALFLWIRGLPGNWIAFAPVILMLGVMALIIRPQE